MRKVAIAALAVLALGIVAVPALASHSEVSLSGSNFEIDTDANLKVDDAAPSIDWAGVTQDFKDDLASGAGDNSFGQGAKEDTPSPSVVSGSIPNGKADLKSFGSYLETNANGKFLNVYWTRVQEPSGSTNVDFEFNKSTTISSNGVTPVRTAGDALIQYDLAQGGTTVQLFLSRWITTGANSQCASQGGKVPCWGNVPPLAPRQNLTSAGLGTGSINTSAIPAADSDIIGAPLSARTFGEAQIDFGAFTQGGGGGTDPCLTFGSAFLKSRSADSVSAELKDFIAPLPVNISNCGAVKIIKKDDAGNVLAGAEFTLYKDNAPVGGTRGAEDLITNPVQKCTTVANGECTIQSVVQGSYWVVETVTPAGHDTAADQPVTVTADATVTLTFIDPAHKGAIQVTKTAKNAEAVGKSINLEGVIFTIKGTDPAVTATTNANGVACFNDLAFGDYTIVESVPTDYAPERDAATGEPITEKDATVDNKAACTDTPFGGEKLTFVNNPLTDILVSVDSHVDGGTSSTIDCVDADDASVGSGSTTTGGDTAAGEVAADDLEPGTYVCTVVIDP